MKLKITHAIIGLCLFLLNATLASHAQDREPKTNIPIIQAFRDDRPIILNSDLVSLTVTVTDKHGRSITGLERSAFSVLDEKVPQEISYFSDGDSPASIAILFDVSGSMDEEKIKSAKAALAQFMQTGHQDDEYFLINFDSAAHLLLDGTHDEEAILRKFTYVQTQGNTALYDAVAFGVEKLSQGRFAKRAAILISDGEDNRSRRTFNELRRQLQEADVAIYTIQIGIPLPRSSASYVLSELAGVSGGKAFQYQNRDSMREAFERIALELRQQYSIAFFPSGFVPDGRRRNIKVKVVPPEGPTQVIVRHRKAYTASREISDGSR
jgi:Ca-activated chloride channel family protein